MHMLRRDADPNFARNSEAPAAESPVRVPTPPEGGWSVWHLTDEDDMGEGIEQGLIIRVLLAALAELARERDWRRSLVASDNFFAWVEADPRVRVSPDVYVLDDPPATYPCSWQTWRPGHPPPRFAVEVVSDDWQKDYKHAPPKYDQLGARELVIFDPDAVTHPRSHRVPLQVYRRDPAGLWAPVASGDGPVHSVELDAWLVIVPGPRLRIARDAAGLDLVQIPEEQVVALRSENIALRRENTALRARVDALEQRVLAQDRIIREQEEIIQAQAATIQTQAATIQALEARVATLEAHIATLEALVASLLARQS
jgi:Uma2 family endonuclease/cell division protein FtsB